MAEYSTVYVWPEEPCVICAVPTMHGLHQADTTVPCCTQHTREVLTSIPAGGALQSLLMRPGERSA